MAKQLALEVLQAASGVSSTESDFQTGVSQIISKLESGDIVSKLDESGNARIMQWVSDGSASVDSGSELKLLEKMNEELLLQPYLASFQLSAADVVLFVLIRPVFSKLKDERITLFPNVTRWFDLMQHVLQQSHSELSKTLTIKLVAKKKAKGSGGTPKKPAAAAEEKKEEAAPATAGKGKGRKKKGKRMH